MTFLRKGQHCGKTLKKCLSKVSIVNRWRVWTMFWAGNLVALIRRRSRQERLYLTNKPLKLIRLHTCYLPTLTNNSVAQRGPDLCNIPYKSYFMFSDSLNHIDISASWRLSQIRILQGVTFSPWSPLSPLSPFSPWKSETKWNHQFFSQMKFIELSRLAGNESSLLSRTTHVSAVRAARAKSTVIDSGIPWTGNRKARS